MDETIDIIRQTGYKGTMKKSIADMTTDEYKAWQIQANIEIKSSLFAKNMPFVHKKEGRVVAEYADGKIEVIR